MNRRKLLQAAGSASALGAIMGSATADARQQTHEICINAPSDRLYPYQFAVTGTIEKLDSVSHAPYRDDVVTSDAEDDIDGTGCRVHGAVQGGVDCYGFTGDIVAFTVPEQWENNFTIHTNGHERPASELQTQQDPSEVECASSAEDTDTASGSDDSSGDWCPLENEIRFVTTSGNAVPGPMRFDVVVTGQLELEDGQRVSRVQGEVGTNDYIAFPYSGEIERLSISGQGSVRLDQADDCQ